MYVRVIVRQIDRTFLGYSVGLYLHQAHHYYSTTLSCYNKAMIEIYIPFTKYELHTISCLLGSWMPPFQPHFLPGGGSRRYLINHWFKRAKSDSGIRNTFTVHPFINLFVQFSTQQDDSIINKSSAVAEMGNRGHSRHGPKKRGGCCAPFAGSWDPV